MKKLRIWELFECERCGKCCENTALPLPNPHIDANDTLERMADYLNITKKEIVNKYYGELTEDNMIEMDENKRKPCPFFTKKDGIAICLIYSVRPSGCKFFPFETDGGTCGIDCKAAEIAREKKAKEEKQELEKKYGKLL